MYIHVIQTVAKDHAPTSGEFFRLLARLLNHTHQMQIPIQGVNKLLELELKWLLNVRVSDVLLGAATKLCLCVHIHVPDNLSMHAECNTILCMVHVNAQCSVVAHNCMLFNLTLPHTRRRP